jgi:hypothetical protein
VNFVVWGYYRLLRAEKNFLEIFQRVSISIQQAILTSKTQTQTPKRCTRTKMFYILSNGHSVLKTLNAVLKIWHQQSLIVMHLRVKIAIAFGSQKIRARIDDPSIGPIFLGQFVWLCIQITSTNNVNYDYKNV